MRLLKNKREFLIDLIDAEGSLVYSAKFKMNYFFSKNRVVFFKFLISKSQAINS